MKNRQEDHALLSFESRLGKLEDLIFRKNKAEAGRNEDMGKCRSSLNKFETAGLFFILMDEGLLYFDPFDKRKNRSCFQKFISANFTYSGEEQRQTKINAVSRQFSECTGFTYREKQMRFLDRLLLILQDRKNRMAGQ